jgi:hypothetical protein
MAMGIMCDVTSKSYILPRGKTSKTSKNFKKWRRSQNFKILPKLQNCTHFFGQNFKILSKLQKLAKTSKSYENFNFRTWRFGPR